MRAFVIAIALSASFSATALADGACMTASDLSFAPAIARRIADIDTAHKGCVTAEQIKAYKAAVKADRAGQRERIAAALATH
jgi:glutathione S-transferase